MSSALKERGIVDEGRMAVSGWSYGGFMTVWLIARRFEQETVIVLWQRNDDAVVWLPYFAPLHKMEMCVHGAVAALTALIRQGEISIRDRMANTELAAWGVRSLTF